MDRKSITFRHPLHSEVIDTLRHAGLSCVMTADLIVSVISLLANYEEEGKHLSPDIFVCNSITQLVRRLGTGEFVKLGSVTLDGKAGVKILKEAAPLATGNWAIFCERTGDSEVSYGLFISSTDPSAVSMIETALETPDEKFPVLLLRRLGRNKVEIRSNSSRSRSFHFNGEDSSADFSDADVDELARCIATGAPEEISEALPGFVKRVLSEALQNSHGALIAVTATGQEIPASLNDMVRLEPYIDLADRLRQHRLDCSPRSLVALQAASNLLQGIISSDGITVFEQGGKLLGYRAFIQSPAPPPGTTGGARTRAFNALSEKVGSEFKAAFFCSQDGTTKLKI